jgi:hypothetical protein
MNKVFDKLSEKSKAIGQAFVDVLKAIWADERSGPYIVATLTAALAYCPLSDMILSVKYPELVIWGATAAVFLVVFLVYKYIKNEAELYNGAPLRTGTKILYSVALPIVALAVALFATLTHFANKGMFMATVQRFLAFDLYTMISIAVVIAIVAVWSWLNYRGLNKK